MGRERETRGKTQRYTLKTKTSPQKKVLSLVLCVAMLLSVMVMGTGAAFTDEDDFSPQYAEAAEVLAGMKVMQGYDDGSFLPQRNITRAQVATMIYRAATSDVTDTQTPIYADYDKFDDVQSDDWFAGYVNYCGNAELIKGFTPTTFGPNKNVTGYQVLAMILRAVGYDANDEFTGSGWEIRTASTAQQLGMLDNVQEATLGQPATRELVAELIFQALNVNMVKYMPAVGYVKQDTTLGEQEFELTNKGDNHDDWGRPGTLWTYNTGDESTLVMEDPLATYTTAVTECDIADDVNQNKDKTYTLYTNGEINDTRYNVQPTDTVQTLGAQGTLTEVYDNCIVVIDTFLAKVTEVKDAAFDAAGHLKTPATITLTVYDNANGTANYKLTKDDATNYEYEVGDYVLINAYTNNTSNSTTGAVTVNGVVATGNNKYAKILGVAEAMTGAQTTLHYNDLQHTINGTTYDDAKWFALDQAGTETVNHTWFFDSYGNLIGAIDIATQYSYGIVESIQWVNPVGANGYAQATIRYMDGNTDSQTIDAIDGKALTYAASNAQGDFSNGLISTTLQNNASECGEDLYRIETNADGSLDLVHVFTVASPNTNNELTNATIKTGLAAITGTANMTAGPVYVNSDTIFLVRTLNATGYTYTVVNGYENIATYTGTATVDWVNLDSDNYAEYVYVTGTPDNATYYGLFYLTSDNATAVLNTSGGIDYYELTGIVDGVAGTIRLDGTATLNDGGTNYPISGLTETQLEDKLSSYVNQMFTIYHVEDEVTQMWGPKADMNNLFSETHSNAAYANLALDYQPASATAGTITYNGQVLKVANSYYNVVGLTPVVGSEYWTAPVDLSNMNVYVIYDTTNMVAKAVYIAAPAETGDNSGVTPSTNDTISLVNMGNSYTATMFKGTSTAIDGDTAVVLQRRPAGSTEWQNAIGLTYTTGDGNVATPYTYTGSYTNGGVSAQYEMRAVAMNGSTIIAASNIIDVYS